MSLSTYERPSSATSSILTWPRLWGNPDHLKSLTNSLHERYSEDRLHVLVTKRNSGSFTYDGAEIGGERAVVEARPPVPVKGKREPVPAFLLRELRWQV